MPVTPTDQLSDIAAKLQVLDRERSELMQLRDEMIVSLFATGQFTKTDLAERAKVTKMRVGVIVNKGAARDGGTSGQPTPSGGSDAARQP